MSEEVYSVRDGWHKRPSDIDKLAPALVRAQGQIEGAVKGSKNDAFRGNKYANLSSVWDACKDALQANELAVVQLPCKAPPGYIGLTTTIIHSSGQSISETFQMPLKDPTNPQAAGSALTYARRYALSAAIGICPEDDDGNAAAKAAPKAPSAPAVDVAGIISAFKTSFKVAGPEQKKAVFLEARNSNIPEPEKTQLLTEMAKVLKGGK